MALTNNLRKGLDLPTWEWLRFLPVSTAAAFVSATSPTGTDRFIYYCTTTTFWRYDTWTDGWQQLETPTTATVTWAAMMMAPNQGFRARALGSTSGSILAPALYGDQFVGSKLRIFGGTGMGQERNITAVSDPITYDHGILTTAAVGQLTDSTKKWKINQWSGYQVRLSYAAGSPQVRNILYNDATNLYLTDTNYQAIDHWNNTGFSSIGAPRTAPVAQTTYVIEASNIYVDSAWTTTPDSSSRFMVMGGGIWLASNRTSTPFYTLQFYDILEDSWTTKTSTTLLIPAAQPTDGTLVIFDETCGLQPTTSFSSPVMSTASYLPYLTSSVSTGSIYFAPSSSFVDTTQNLIPDKYTNYQVRITSGTGMGQKRRIMAHSGSWFQVERNWDILPNSSSTYQILGDSDKIDFIPAGTSAGVYQYNVESDLMALGNSYYSGVSRQMSAAWYGTASMAGSGSFSPYEPVGLTSIAKVSGSVMSINLIPTLGGNGYLPGDILTISSGSGNAQALVLSTGISGSSTGSVLSVEIYAIGSGYSGSIGGVTTGGNGTGCVLSGSFISTGSRVTTAINHWFKKGDPVLLGGTNDSTWNTNYTILCSNSLTAFDITCSATAGPTNASTLTTTLLVDSAQNWQPNELVGKLCMKSLAGGAVSTGDVRRITANTTNTATLQSALTANWINGTGRYIICDNECFGRDEQYKNPRLNGRGYASSSSLSSATMSLIDSSKNWNYNQWSGSSFRILAGSGSYGVNIVSGSIPIFGNNATTLFYLTTSIGPVGNSFLPDSSSKYSILDTYGLATGGSGTTLVDVTKNWTTNQWAGKILRTTSGTNLCQDVAISSNTSNTITLGSISAPDTTTTYVILGAPARSTGIEGKWVYAGSTPDVAGKYIWCAVGGGSNKIERFNINTGMWDYGIFFNPNMETISTGTMYAYDGCDRIYFTTNATNRVMYLDLSKNTVIPYGMNPYAQGTAIIGNRMEVIKTPQDGLQFLAVMRHGGQEWWRTLLYV